MHNKSSDFKDYHCAALPKMHIKEPVTQQYPKESHIIVELLLINCISDDIVSLNPGNCIPTCSLRIRALTETHPLSPPIRQTFIPTTTICIIAMMLCVHFTNRIYSCSRKSYESFMSSQVVVESSSLFKLRKLNSQNNNTPSVTRLFSQGRVARTSSCRGSTCRVATRA